MARNQKPLDVLEEAHAIVHGDRAADYGDFRDSLVRWRDMCHASGRPGLADITAEDLATMMILLKVCRDSVNPKRDNAVDIAGFAFGLDAARGE